MRVVRFFLGILFLLQIGAGCSLVVIECAAADLACAPFLLLLRSRVVIPSLSAGLNHSCALKGSSLHCWGNGANGRLGYGDVSPVGDGNGPSIAGAGDVSVGAAVLSMEVGGGHSCVRLQSGDARCWGDGGSGQLGYNAATDVANGAGPSIGIAGNIPIGAAVLQVSGGNTHTCAVLDTGNVRCWGNGARGRLGYNTTAAVGNGVGLSITAAGDVPIGATVKWVEAGGNHTCALMTTGAVRCWGRGSEGQLGYNAGADIGGGGATILASGDVPLGGIATQIALGLDHSCALLDTGAVRCWGKNNFGQLGHDNLTFIGNGGTSIIAAGDIPLGGTATSIAAAWDTTCALLSGGSVRCWGNGVNGQLGHDDKLSLSDGTGRTIVAAGDIPIGGWAVAVAVGQTFACAVLADGAVRCWGDGTSGVLGHDSTASIGDGTGPTIVAAGNVPLP